VHAHAGASQREHLQFQTDLRLPASMSEQQKAARIDSVVAELGLGSCDGTLIGAISGGERKRLSFAASVLTDPAVLFADEPTSGLDSAMAEQVRLK
jgi:ABC-type multidrug transport system ATPase subunit